MSYQVKCHNEVNLIGRIFGVTRGVKCNNQNAIKVRLLLPNDEDYNQEPNTAFVYFYCNDNKFLKDCRGRAIAVSGHIECNYGQRIIADCFTFLKEAE